MAMIKTLLLIPFVALLVGCGYHENLKCKFNEGDIVLSVLSGQRGQVYSRYTHKCTYYVRFVSGGETEHFKEFELKAEVKKEDDF